MTYTHKKVSFAIIEEVCDDREPISMANKQSFFDCKKAKGGGIVIPKAFRYFNSLDTDTSSSPLRKSRSASLLDIFDTWN
jgi:hypothetical protein